MYVAEALDSVFAQTRDDYEVIVINDGSPDTPALEQALEPYRSRIVYLVQENRGISGARNTGILHARGEYIALLDSDDVWERDYLEVQLAELAQDPSIDVLYPDATIFGDVLEAGRRSMELSPSSGPVTFLSLVTQQCNVRVFVTARRETILRAGLFDESLRSSEDFDMWLRIVKLGGRISYHRRSLVRYRRHRTSLSADSIWMCTHILQVLEKAGRTLELTAEEQEVVTHELARWQATLALHKAKKHFFLGESTEAYNYLREANRFFQRRKLALAGLMIRVFPRALLHAYDLRDRIVFRRSTRR
jgi:glycosyltransferase involved in cell wall biosynthesis